MLRPLEQILFVDPSTVRIAGYASVSGVPFKFVDLWEMRIRDMVVDRGAFKNWLSHNGNNPIPIHWAHETFKFQIGETERIYEDKHGLAFEGRAVVNTGAVDALTTMAGRSKVGASLILDFGETVTDKKGLEHIVDVADVWEMGPCPQGVNPAAYATLVEVSSEEAAAPAPAMADVDREGAAMAAEIYRTIARLRRI